MNGESDRLFGDPKDFAIESGVEPGLARPTAGWGHMCVWCRGVALGDITNTHCGLYGAFCGFRTLLENLDDLWDESFVGLDAQATWNLLDGRLYGYHGDVEIADDRILAEIKADSARYGRF